MDGARGLERDGFRPSALGYDLGMIFSHNRFALFRIMLEGER